MLSKCTYRQFTILLLNKISMQDLQNEFQEVVGSSDIEEYGLLINSMFDGIVENILKKRRGREDEGGNEGNGDDDSDSSFTPTSSDNGGSDDDNNSDDSDDNDIRPSSSFLETIRGSAIFSTVIRSFSNPRDRTAETNNPNGIIVTDDNINITPIRLRPPPSDIVIIPDISETPDIPDIPNRPDIRGFGMRNGSIGINSTYIA